MTKTKRISIATVSVVLAGTMAMGLAACSGNKTVKKGQPVDMNLAQGATLEVAIGYNSEDTGLFYGSAVGTGKTFVGGYSANFGDPKPATRAIMDATGITLKDHYGGDATSSNLTNLVNNTTWGNGVDLATSDLTVAATQATNGRVLNLADYLQYMPNFEKFLEENPIVYLSVLGYGMNTKNGEDEALYVAPYFDGMDDIEKGVLMRQDWVEAVLDTQWTQQENDNNDTFKSACYAVLETDAETNDPIQTEATGTHATSYMGTTGSWTIVSTTEETWDSSEGTYSTESDGSKTVTIKKDYDAALTAVKQSGNSLNTAYTAITNDSGYSGNSGNIVDIMNAALAMNLEATGAQLANLYRAYIENAYTVDGEKYYGTEDVLYSKVFNGYSACWDVDDLVALLRIIKCSSGQVGLTDKKTVGIFPRTYDNQRTPDIVSLVGELYGVRGATSRYEQTYIDSEGNIQDARNDEKFWDSLVAFGGLAQEGLVDSGYVLNGSYNANSDSTSYTNGMHGTANDEGNGFMQWDYSQTQTTHEFDLEDINYGWVNTPVSLWDDGTTNDSGYSYSESGEKYMRFTDSWRSTKTAGLVVAKSVEDDPAKLAAALAFVDFLYSNDGQITTTYAIQDTTNNSDKPEGTWYGTEVSATSIKSGATYEDICEETCQWEIKPEYSGEYTVYYDKIYDSNGKETELELGDYAEKKIDYSVKEEYQDKCFTFGGKLYTGTLYKGKMTPTITDELFDHFIANTNYTSAGYTSWGAGYAEEPDSAEYNVYSGIRGSFTNFARYILGSTLPICVKDQSFENQMTAEIAQVDATRVGVSLANNTINHCELSITEDNYFYTCVPTGFPFNSLQQESLDGESQATLKYETGTAFNGNGFYSLYHHVIWHGYTGTYNQNGCTVAFDGNISSSADMIAKLVTDGLSRRIGWIREGWSTALSYWEYISNR